MVAKVPLETGLTWAEDAKPFDGATLAVHGDGDQIAPIKASHVLARTDKDRLSAVFLTVIRR